MHAQNFAALFHSAPKSCLLVLSDTLFPAVLTLSYFFHSPLITYHTPFLSAPGLAIHPITAYVLFPFSPSFPHTPSSWSRQLVRFFSLQPFKIDFFSLRPLLKQNTCSFPHCESSPGLNFSHFQRLRRRSFSARRRVIRMPRSMDRQQQMKSFTKSTSLPTGAFRSWQVCTHKTLFFLMDIASAPFCAAVFSPFCLFCHCALSVHLRLSFPRRRQSSADCDVL